jgi:hypothetical protein
MAENRNFPATFNVRLSHKISKKKNSNGSDTRSQADKLHVRHSFITLQRKSKAAFILIFADPTDIVVTI